MTTQITPEERERRHAIQMAEMERRIGENTRRIVNELVDRWNVGCRSGVIESESRVEDPKAVRNYMRDAGVDVLIRNAPSGKYEASTIPGRLFELNHVRFDMCKLDEIEPIGNPLAH